MLYRKEVIQYQSNRLNGEVLIINHSFSNYWLYFTLALIILIAYILFTVEYSKKRVVNGRVVPKEGIISIFGGETGVIVNSHISGGYSVNKNDTLFTVDTTKKQYEKSTVEQLILSFKDKINEKERVLLNKEKSFEIKISELNSKEDILISKIDLLKKRIKSLDESIVLREQKLKQYKGYRERGLVRESELTNAKQMYWNAKNEMNSALETLLSLESELSLVRSNMVSEPIDYANLKQEIQLSIKELKEQLIELEGASKYTINAPVSGDISLISAQIGQTISTNSLLATIVPEDAEFIVEIFIPTDGVGFVEDGQKVKIRYDAFPYEHYGLINGTITSIGQSPVSISQIDSSINSNQLVYIARVKLDKQSINLRDKSYSLKPGMTLSATIVLDKRRIVDWILKPILKLKWG